MSKQLDTRISKLENILLPSKPCPLRLRLYGDQCGIHGESIPQETQEEAIARHLTAFPDDAGREFDFTYISIVHGRWSESGQLVCNDPSCINYNTASD
jgi:hypothetical protein